MEKCILPETRVSRMLKEYPQTLEVLVAASPHFSRLKNPVLRKTLAGRVTVAQAARMAGLEVHDLLRDLNAAIGRQREFADWLAAQGAAGAGAASEKEGASLEVVRGRPEKVLDVRPIIDAGKDPFHDIMATVKALRGNEVLHLINSFEPIPLYSVMQKKGFAHVTEKKDGVFHVYFYRAEEVTEETSGGGAGGEVVSATGKPPETGDRVELDVRDLGPPEPMVRILETLNTLPEGAVLVVRHHREPMLLYDKLRDRGYAWQVERLGEHEYVVRIWKA